MRYLGGKHYSSKQIIPFLLRHDPERIVEPFIGGGHILLRGIREGYTGEWIAGDGDAELTELWRAVVEDGWIPDIEDKPSKEEYDNMRADVGASPTPLRGFIRSSASYGGIPWGGYALHLLDKRGRIDPWSSYVRTMKREAELITSSDTSVKIVGGDYSGYTNQINANTVVYCDPPYASTRKYSEDGFDSDRFWNVIREWSKTCPVYVSEFAAPDDFTALWNVPMQNRMSGGTSGETKNRDTLFTLRGGLGDLPLTP